MVIGTKAETVIKIRYKIWNYFNFDIEKKEEEKK